MKQSITQYLVVLALIVGAYMLGTYKTKVEYLEKGVPTGQTQDNQVQPETKTVLTEADLDAVEKVFNDKEALVFGDKKAKIKFVEFLDTSCPYCHIAGGVNPTLNKEAGERFTMVQDGGSYIPAVPEIKKLVTEGKAALAWLYTPGHGNGEMGTLALYCANEKNRFCEAHDLLMSSEGYELLNNTVKNDRNQAETLAGFLSPAVETGFMKECLTSGKYDSRISGDPTIASSLGFGATPTFFVNEQVIEGAVGWDEGFKAIVDSLL